MAAPAPGPGGIGSAEHTAALAHVPGRPRRNSVTQAGDIHAMVPAGVGAGVNRGQLEGIRTAAGHMPAAALMALVPPGTEQPWNPLIGGGRDRILTGRNWQVPDTAGGAPFNIRIHTNDHGHLVAPGSHAYDNPILRVEQGAGRRREVLLGTTMPHPDPLRGNVDWSRSGADAFVNASHIPADFPAPVAVAPPVAVVAPPVAPPPPAVMPPPLLAAIVAHGGVGALRHAPLAPPIAAPMGAPMAAPMAAPHAAPIIPATPPVRARSCGFCALM